MLWVKLLGYCFSCRKMSFIGSKLTSESWFPYVDVHTFPALTNGETTWWRYVPESLPSMASPEIRSPLRTTRSEFSPERMELMTPWVNESRDASESQSQWAFCHKHCTTPTLRASRTYHQKSASRWIQRFESCCLHWISGSCHQISSGAPASYSIEF